MAVDDAFSEGCGVYCRHRRVSQGPVATRGNGGMGTGSGVRQLHFVTSSKWIDNGALFLMADRFVLPYHMLALSLFLVGVWSLWVRLFVCCAVAAS